MAEVASIMQGEPVKACGKEPEEPVCGDNPTNCPGAYTQDHGGTIGVVVFMFNTARPSDEVMFSDEEWERFLRDVKAGKFDLDRLAPKK